MKNKVKILLCITMLVIMAVFTSACTVKDSYIDDEKDDSLLQIYLIEYNSDQQDVINKYNRAIREGKIDGRVIEITEFEIEEIESMYDRISSEMISGKGPDIIFIDRGLDMYLDFVKMSQQDAFADMDILIETSDTFSFEDYNKTALDAGIINEKRIMMPLSYNIDYIITTQENLDMMDFETPDSMTYDGFFEMIQKYHKDNDGIGAMYLSDNMVVNMIIQNEFQTDNIEELEKCINLEIEDMKRYSSFGNIGTAAEFYQHLCNGDILFDYRETTISGRGAFLLLGERYNLVENLYDKTFVIMNTPGYSGDDSCGYIDLGCAINMNSKHKNDAFKFVEFLMSEECQYSSDVKMSTLPINKAAYQRAKTDFDNDVFGVFFNGSDNMYLKTALSDELKNYYINLVENINEYKYIGQQRYIIKHVIGDTIDDYINRKISFETLVEDINQKIELYFTE